MSQAVGQIFCPAIEMAGRSALPLATERTQEPLSDAYGINCAELAKLESK